MKKPTPKIHLTFNNRGNIALGLIHKTQRYAPASSKQGRNQT